MAQPNPPEAAIEKLLRTIDAHRIASLFEPDCGKRLRDVCSQDREPEAQLCDEATSNLRHAFAREITPYKPHEPRSR